MEYLRLFIDGAGILCMAALFVLAFFWPKGRGKAFFLVFVGSVLSRTLLIKLFVQLLNRGVIPFDSPLRDIINILFGLMYLAETAFLMLFVIAVLRSQQHPMTVPNAPITSAPRRAAGLPKQKPAGLETASLAMRGLAYFLDVLIIAFPVIPLQMILFLTANGPEEAEIRIFILNLFFYLLAFLYVAYKDSFGGRSIGKRITGLQVVDARTGKPVNGTVSFARNWVLSVPMMPLVELIVASIRPDKRRLGDLMANTLVVQNNAAAAYAAGREPMPPETPATPQATPPETPATGQATPPETPATGLSIPMATPTTPPPASHSAAEVTPPQRQSLLDEAKSLQSALASSPSVIERKQMQARYDQIQRLLRADNEMDPGTDDGTTDTPDRVVVTCPHCGSLLRVHPGQIGTRGKCPHCGERFTARSQDG